MNKSRTVIRRHQYADYLNVGTTIESAVNGVGDKLIW